MTNDDYLALIQKLPESKRRELAERLRRRNAEAAAEAAEVKVAVEAQVDVDPTARFRPFPLGRIQQIYLEGSRPGGAFSRRTAQVYTELELTGPTDDLEARLNHAFGLLVRRHDMLRVSVVDGRQVVREHVEIPVIRVEPASEGLNAERCRRDARALVFELERGDVPFRVWAFREAADRVVVCVILSAFVVDGASRILLGWELHSLLEDPDAVLPDPPLTYCDCLRSLATEQPSEAWHRRLAELPPPLPPLPEPEHSELEYRLDVLLDAAAWSRLKATASTHKISATCLTTVLFCDAVAEELGVADFSFAMMSSYRPQIHARVNEVIGNFNTCIPVAYRFGDRSSFLERAHAFQAELGWVLDHRDGLGLDYLRSLGDLHGRSPDRPPLEFIVNSVFDYIVKGQWRLARIDSESRFAIAERVYWFGIPCVALLPTFAELDDGGFALRFAYERELGELADALRRRFSERIDVLLASDAAWSEQHAWRPVGAGEAGAP